MQKNSIRFNLRDRLLALLALLLFAAIIIAVLWLVITHVFFAILFCFTLFLLANAAWKIFSGHENHGREGYILFAIGLIALTSELIAFGSAGNLLVWAIIVLTAIVFILIVGHLRNVFWRAVRSAHESSGITAQFRKPFLIVNPKSGNGRAIKARIPELATRQGIKVLMTQKGVNVAKTALQAIEDGADVLGISGGDGSIGAVAKVAIEHTVPMVVLPGGTRCHFARDIGLDPNHIADSLAAFHGVERRIDVGDLNGRIFLNNASFGLYADIVSRADYRDNKRRVTREVLQNIASGAKPAYTLRFNRGKKKFNAAVMVLVAVNAYNSANIFEIGQREKLDAGTLQITALTALDDTSLKQLLRSPFSSTENPGIEQWESALFTIAAPGKYVSAGVDGESEKFQNPIKIRLLPRKLRVYVPAEGIRGRPKRALSWFMVGKLWRAVAYGSA